MVSKKKSNEIVKKMMKQYRSFLERELGSGGGGVVFGAFRVWPHPARPGNWAPDLRDFPNGNFCLWFLLFHFLGLS